jgi:hypothetical protein
MIKCLEDREEPMKDLRAFALVLMGIVCGLIWGGACGGTVSMSSPVQAPPAVALLTYDVADGTSGGTSTGGAWTNRPLNTEAYDPAGIVTLAADQFTLGPGTYLIAADQVFFDNGDNQKSFRGRLRNITAGTTVALSLDVRLHEGPSESGVISCPIPRTLVTLAAPATFELQYFCQTADVQPTSLGFPMATGEVERYAFVSIEQIN